MVLDRFSCCRKKESKGEGGKEREDGRGWKGEEGRGRKEEGWRYGHSLHLKQLHIVKVVPGIELKNEYTVDPRSPPPIRVDGKCKEPQYNYEPSSQPSKHGIIICPNFMVSKHGTQDQDNDANKNDSHEPTRSQCDPM